MVALALLIVATGQPVVTAQVPAGTLRYTVVGDGSEARYRVREQLVGLPLPNDAVGTTRAIEGQVVFDGSGRLVAGESRITVGLRSLQSDEARRDRYVQRVTLDTERFPVVVFVPVEIRGLPAPLPATGALPFQMTGRLTVRGRTQPVTWESTATLAGPRVTVRAWTTFRFGDFEIPVPRVSVVLSVEDRIRLEADLELRRES